MGWQTYRKWVFSILGILGLIGLPSFWDHLSFFLSGQVDQLVIQQRWDLVALNIGGFLLFLLPLAYRRKADWQSFGIYAAFTISLFIEMYGIPLTIYLSSAFAFSSSAAAPAYLVSFSFLGQQFGMTLWMLIGAGITLLGMVIVAVGWYTIYKTDDELVISGIYAYSRHPQYLGIMLIAAGWFIGWPTILTAVILPILIYRYYRLCFDEEDEVIQQLDDPQAYETYRQNVPLLL